MDLKNAVALITGGSSGIGRAIAQSLVASGARVAITGRDERRLAEAAREMGVHPIHADVAVEADVERTYREVLQKFGDLDILVNNAGIGVFKNLVDFNREEFEAVFATRQSGVTEAAIREHVKNQAIVAHGRSGNAPKVFVANRVERVGVLGQQQLGESLHGPIGGAQIMGNAVAKRFNGFFGGLQLGGAFGHLCCQVQGVGFQQALRGLE